MINEEKIRDLFQKIAIFKKNGERAPHKPLLALIGLRRCLNNEPRLDNYLNVSEQLSELLKEFGRPTKNVAPEHPYVRMQRDKIWELANPSKITIHKNGNPSVKDLRSTNMEAGFPVEIDEFLRKHPNFSKQLIQELLDDHFPETLHREIIESIGISTGVYFSQRKKRDPRFREMVLNNYGYQCAICGFHVQLGKTSIGLEAAHIKWHNADGPDIVTNGMALCPLHHNLFDRGIFSLTETRKLIVSTQAHGAGNSAFEEMVLRFNGQDLRKPIQNDTVPGIPYIQWHQKEVFKGPGRVV
jgi:putative restriction endonuclease